MNQEGTMVAADFEFNGVCFRVQMIGETNVDVVVDCISAIVGEIV